MRTTSFWPISCPSVGEPDPFAGEIDAGGGLGGALFGALVGVLVGGIDVSGELGGALFGASVGMIDVAGGVAGAAVGPEVEAGMWLLHPATTNAATSTMPNDFIIDLTNL